MSTELSIGRYVLKFGMVYIIGIILLTTGFIIFDLSHSAYASVIILLGAVFFTASEFIQDYRRVPNKKEKSKLIWLSFLMSWLILVILVLAAVLFLGGQQAVAEFWNILRQAGAAKLIGAFALISLVHLTIFFLGYGKIAQIQYNKMRNNGVIL